MPYLELGAGSSLAVAVHHDIGLVAHHHDWHGSGPLALVYLVAYLAHLLEGGRIANVVHENECVRRSDR